MAAIKALEPLRKSVDHLRQMPHAVTALPIHIGRHHHRTDQTGTPKRSARLLTHQDWHRGIELVEVSLDAGARFEHVSPRLSALSSGDRWLVWIGLEDIPSLDELIARDIAPSRFLVVRVKQRERAFNALIRALSSGTCAMVIGQLPTPTEYELKQLKQAAHAGRAQGVIFMAK